MQKGFIQSRFLKAGFALFILCMLIWLSAGPYPTIQDDKGWHIVWEGSFAEAMEETTISGDGSGIIGIYFVNTSDAGGRAQNATYTIQGWCNASGFGYCNADDQQVDLKSSTNFEIWVRIRANATIAKRGANWFDSDIRVRITSADMSIGADTACTNYVSSNNSAYTFLYVNCVLAGPYTISKGQTLQITSIKFEAYY